MDPEGFFRRVREGLRDGISGLCYPPHCGACGVRLSRDCPADSSHVKGLCGECCVAITPPITPCCPVCSHPVLPGVPCPNCGDLRRSVTAIIPACRYTGLARELLRRFKYGRDECLAVSLADLLGGTFGDDRLRDVSFQALVPVPLHPRRLRERGFNQAEVLARLAGRDREISVRGLLRRVRETAPQAGFDRRERIGNLRGAFEAGPLEKPGGDYLLVDDVSTTGATFDACAEALLLAGAGRVYAIAVARG